MIYGRCILKLEGTVMNLHARAIINHEDLLYPVKFNEKSCPKVKSQGKSIMYFQRSVFHYVLRSMNLSSASSSLPSPSRDIHCLLLCRRWVSSAVHVLVLLLGQAVVAFNLLFVDALDETLHSLFHSEVVLLGGQLAAVAALTAVIGLH